MSNPVAITSVFNDGYVAEAYETYRRDPSQVDESWRQFFRFAESLGGAAPAAGGVSADQLRVAAGAAALADAVRHYGHLAVQIDPLGSPPPGAPELDPAFHGVTEAELATIPASALGLGDGTAADAVARLRGIYSGRVGFEFGHVAGGDERLWLREKVEGGALTPEFSADERKAILRRLTEVDGLERAIQLFFQGKKRFSIEGTDALVPMLDAAIDGSIAQGAGEVIVGMAHRGRLNVLTNVLGKPHATLFREFKGEHATATSDADTGDVKYHMGWCGERAGANGAVRVQLLPNPSHLEFVNPVINGVARARGERGKGDVLTVCVHGDAAFIGEGVVAETFNMARLRGYAVGGTLHIIANNQIGFTTDPTDSRSTHYASDLAKGFDVPVVHVNGDDPEACIAAVRFGLEYRKRFAKDFLIDLVGYRRYGHNETDEPLFTQPTLYGVIKAHPTPRQVWGARLVAEGVIAQADVDAVDREVQDAYRAAFESTKNAPDDQNVSESCTEHGAPPARQSPDTAVPAERLVALATALQTYPEGFTPNPRLAKVLARRTETLGDAGGIDWGNAESLAFASLVTDGVSVRLTGQDAERGTFGHRNAVLHDAKTGEIHEPLQHLPGATAKFEVYNSPLSETAVMGFEYGYSVAAPDALTLWEAQYGDFYNVAQTIVDQFVAAGYAKWSQESGLALLLPHGYEGGGPEHSSARLERFLQMCADDNMIVAYPSTSAQYFHILRRHAGITPRRPLVLMQPKWMLRLPEASSKLSDLATGGFQPVVDDPRQADATRAGVRRVVLSTAKMYYELSMNAARTDAVALVRIDELYPWPAEELAEVLARYPNARELVWAQEEPANMGAWAYVAPRLASMSGALGAARYVGRPERASPAEGYESVHVETQRRIVAEALGVNGVGGASAEGASVPASSQDTGKDSGTNAGKDAKGAAKGKKAAAR